MEMKYFSTRGKAETVESAKAVLQGIAEDGGLFVPTEIPKIDANFMQELVALSYAERAKKILGLFLTDYTDEEIARCIEGAYGDGKFDDAAVAPVKCVGDVSVLELWHGPTSAFKDMALQLLPRLLSEALKKTGETKETLILVATSGDTGKAALAGFADVPQTKIMVFYPNGGVSDMQRLQMVTQEGGNVCVEAVKGNFDDAQTGVKEIFGDAGFAAKLDGAGVRLSSANSINWGRLVPQIVYYFSAYADLVKAGTIKNGDQINFTVPTGNFGNILAGFYARQMGLPVGKLICASNQNGFPANGLLRQEPRLLQDDLTVNGYPRFEQCGADALSYDRRSQRCAGMDGSAGDGRTLRCRRRHDPAVPELFLGRLGRRRQDERDNP